MVTGLVHSDSSAESGEDAPTDPAAAAAAAIALAEGKKAKAGAAKLKKKKKCKAATLAAVASGSASAATVASSGSGRLPASIPHEELGLAPAADVLAMEVDAEVAPAPAAGDVEMKPQAKTKLSKKQAAEAKASAKLYTAGELALGKGADIMRLTSCNLWRCLNITGNETCLHTLR